ncbi:MAG: ribonuclease catalytic domain-containing protein, partial [Nitrospirota bacterium]
MRSHRTDLKNIARRAMIERGLLPDFSAAAMTELARIETAATDRHSNLRDLTGLLWASIDNDDSRDLDQLTVAEPHPDRSVTILVAIADVDELVIKESALDAHAKHNTTSVYTAGDMFPMLPEKLSTDLTSLGEGQDRLAIIVEMVIAEDGAVLSSVLFRALVRNRAKLAYNSVAAWLAGEAPAPERVTAVSGLDVQLRLQDQVAQRLKVRRHQQGALSLETIEPRAVFDGEVLTDLRVEQKNRAKELIEDFMIAANQA